MSEFYQWHETGHFSREYSKFSEFNGGYYESGLFKKLNLLFFELISIQKSKLSLKILKVSSDF